MELASFCTQRESVAPGCMGLHQVAWRRTRVHHFFSCQRTLSPLRATSARSPERATIYTDEPCAIVMTFAHGDSRIARKSLKNRSKKCAGLRFCRKSFCAIVTIFAQKDLRRARAPSLAQASGDAIVALAAPRRSGVGGDVGEEFVEVVAGDAPEAEELYARRVDDAAAAEVEDVAPR
jgi:hypothetical protein